MIETEALSPNGAAATGPVASPTVLYASALVKVICGDAREVLATLASESVDVVVTDPPYGTRWRSNYRKEKFDSIEGDGSLGEASDLLTSVTPDLVRVLRRRRHAYTFGLALTDPLVLVKANLVWDKGILGSGNLSQPWGPDHEPIFFHVRAGDKSKAERKGTLAARLRRGSIIRVPRLNSGQIKRHPTEKPVELMAHLIESSTTRGELVLDPFAGCGSTGVAALVTGRRALIIELDPRYAAMAAARCQQAEAVMAQVLSL